VAKQIDVLARATERQFGDLHHFVLPNWTSIDRSKRMCSMAKHHYHAVIWIDHREARVFHFGLTDVEHVVLHPDHPTKHIHHKANSIGSGHASADQGYLHAVAESVADAGAVLITGPANAKTELVEHIRVHDPRLTKLIVGVETVDHPSDPQLVAHAKKYFMAADRMRP
jgi:stalled ribosome rescue protein Dom34